MKSGCTLEPVPNGSGATVCVTLVYCGQTFGQIKLKRGTQVGLGHGHIVLDVPQFSAHLYCAETAGWIKMMYGTEVGLGLRHIVLDGGPAPPPQRGTAHICCGQMAAWIKMSLGMEVRLDPGHIVLDGDPAPPL